MSSIKTILDQKHSVDLHRGRITSVNVSKHAIEILNLIDNETFQFMQNIALYLHITLPESGSLELEGIESDLFATIIQETHFFRNIFSNNLH